MNSARAFLTFRVLRTVLIATSMLFLTEPISAQEARGPARLIITPADALVDDEVRVVLSGVPAASRVTIRARETDRAGTRWEAVGEYHADARGRVDPAVAASVAGTYTGVDPRGLLWSMSPVPPGRLAAYWQEMAAGGPNPRFPVREGLAPRRVTFIAEAGGEVIDSAELTLRQIAPGVREEVVEAGDLRGVLFLPEGRTDRAGVVTIGGSTGGLDVAWAALLASRGHPALALGYFQYADRPASAVDLPLEYFRDAARWLASRLGHGRIALLGVSRGSEAVLLTGASFPDDVAAVVAWVPSPMVNNGEGREWGDWTTLEASMWSLDGAPVPFAPYVPTQTEDVRSRRAREKRQPAGYRSAPEYLEIWLDPGNARYEIAVERIRGPVMLVGGAADDMWPSGLGAHRIAARLADHAHPYGVTTLVYQGAGHSIRLPGRVTTFSTAFHIGENLGGFVATGGVPSMNARASLDAWRRLLEFLEAIPGEEP